jgi:hypothetical protein
MAKRPGERYRSCAEMLALMRRALRR